MAVRRQITKAPRRARSTTKKELSLDLALAALARSIRVDDLARREARRRGEATRADLAHSTTAYNCTSHLRYARQPNHALLAGPTRPEVFAKLKEATVAGFAAQQPAMPQVFRLTPKGMRHLAKQRREGSLPELPPAPVWREWNRLRLYALHEYPGALANAERLLKLQAGRLPGDNPTITVLRRFKKSSEPTRYFPGLDERAAHALSHLHHLVAHLLAPEPPKY